MTTQFFSVAVISLLGAMLPGPDFAIVTKNSFFYSRKAGYLTALGIFTAILVHMTYCVFGLAIVIAKSLLLFTIIKYVGASYLIYLGLVSLFSKQSQDMFSVDGEQKKANISNLTAFKQGFLCNLLNPKATLFFLSFFTVLIKPATPLYLQVIYALEIAFTGLIWFSFLTVILSHAYVKRMLQAAEKYIAKILGLFLISFGVLLVFASNSYAHTTGRVVQFTNDKVVVWETIIYPNKSQALKMHRHDHDRVLVSFDNGLLKIKNDKGSVHYLKLAKNKSYFLHKDVVNELHSDANMSGHPIKVLVMELQE